MRKIIVILWLLLFLILGSLVSSAQEADWNQIVVMRSTQKDVERILGTPGADMNSSGVHAFFVVKNGRLTISYSTGLCEPDQQGGWNIEKGVVDEITLSPANKIRFNSLKIEREKFQKRLEGDSDALSYENDEDGIKYIVLNGMVRHIVYYPGSKFDNIRCGTINGIEN
jgi:hypothetical protein